MDKQQTGKVVGNTVLQQQQMFVDRWSAFGEATGIKRFHAQPKPAELKKLPLFAPYDETFLQGISHDISIATWEKGAILFEEGAYLDLAFSVVSGEVEVYVDKLKKGGVSPIFSATQLMQPDTTNARNDERKRHVSPQMTFLTTMDFDLPHGAAMSLGKGEIFGEIGSLNGWPQSVTARVTQETTLVHIRVAALRAMRKKSDAFKQKLDALYRERTLQSQLATTPLFKHLDASVIDALASRVALDSKSPGEEIVKAGDTCKALYLVRSGFVKLLHEMDGDSFAVSYLSKGMTLGEVELLLDGVEENRYSAEAVGHVELVRIDRSDFNAVLSGEQTAINQMWEMAVASIKNTGHTRANPEKAELLEFGLTKGLAQGNSMLVIDLDVCTRCDDCVTGCANTHEGRPRFVREGDKYENFLIARSCYHCEDPVCLIGCPTGAIKRTNVGEVVAIEDELCIGCGNCSNKCPYDAIVMHETEDSWPESAFPKWLRGRQRKVASKCDLCYTSEAGPACVNSCPHACAFRIGSLDDFQDLLNANKPS